MPPYTKAQSPNVSNKYTLVYTPNPPPPETSPNSTETLGMSPFIFIKGTLNDQQILDKWSHEIKKIDMTLVFRILLQNPNVINPHTNNLDFQWSLQESQNKGIAVIGLSGTNVNWQKQLNYEHIGSSLKKIWCDSSFQLSSGSSSGHHVGHYKAVIDDDLLCILYSTMMSLPFQTGYSPLSWQLITDVMFKKTLAPHRYTANGSSSSMSLSSIKPSKSWSVTNLDTQPRIMTC